MKLKLFVLGTMLCASVGLQAIEKKQCRGLVAVEVCEDYSLKLSLPSCKNDVPLRVKPHNVAFTKNDELIVPMNVSKNDALKYAALASFMKGCKEEGKVYNRFYCKVESGEDSALLISSAVPY